MMMGAIDRLDEALGDDIALIEAEPFLSTNSHAMIELGHQAGEGKDLVQIILEGRFPNLTVSEFHERFRRGKSR